MDRLGDASYRGGGLNPPRTNTAFRIALRLCAIATGLTFRTQALAHGTSHELIEAATRAIAEKPDDAAPYLRRAQFHLEHGDSAACLLDLAEAERRQTQDLGAGLIRGRALAAGGRFAEAKVTLDVFLAAHPDHAAALMQRARALGALERKAEAAEDFVPPVLHAVDFLLVEEGDEITIRERREVCLDAIDELGDTTLLVVAPRVADEDVVGHGESRRIETDSGWCYR